MYFLILGEVKKSADERVLYKMKWTFDESLSYLLSVCTFLNYYQFQRKH